MLLRTACLYIHRRVLEMMIKTLGFVRFVGTATASGIFPEAVEVASSGFFFKPLKPPSQL